VIYAPWQVRLDRIVDRRYGLPPDAATPIKIVPLS
jgi:hypothetical protein